MKRIVLEDGRQSTGKHSGQQPGTSSSNPPDEPHSLRATEQQQRHALPPELMEILVPSLKVGVGAGVLQV